MSAIGPDFLWVYAFMYNEAGAQYDMLSYFLRHYSRFPRTKIIIYFDSDNSDNGPELCKAYPQVEVRTSPMDGPADLQRANWISKQVREAQGQTEWVLQVDADEFIWHPDLPQHLHRRRAEGHLLLRPLDGYVMYAEQFPATPGQIYDEVFMGMKDPGVGKPTLMDARVLVKWIAGRHQVVASSQPVFGDPEITWMHFRHLSPAYIESRNAKSYQRQDAINLAMRHGFQVNPEELENNLRYWRELKTKSVEVNPNGLR